MALTHLLDTSVLISPPALDLDASARLATSVICIGELQAGVLLARDGAARARRLERLTDVTVTVVALAVDQRVAAAYARLRSTSSRRPANDLWIAATAVAHELTLITRDERLAALSGVVTLRV